MLLRMQQPQTATWASSVKRQLPIVRSQIRFYSDKGTNPPVAAPPPPPNPRQPTVGDASAPSAISSATPGVSQPLSTPEGVHTDAQPAASTKPAVERPPSSCPAGTVMNGLNYFKNKPDVVAKEDSEYPDWLWDLLTDSSKQAKSEKGGVDPSTLNKKQRKRYEKKLAARTAVLPPKIPAHHHAEDIVPAPYNRQTIPEDAMLDATEGQIKRSEVTKSAREARRKAIKESNFLRGL
ncbi:Ribosomal protein L37 mitochondrial [Penicillium chermesinum]|uniref:Large ribosomal subunit protein mL54 n=1 Tax=Penicillium chermesinum TaxID=63820 RepID=A0A9W9NH70_9EURO|nr:Ribosomal protein L37 mitochondrial [Penicillium chermesinum]KAJ5219912.1 Ribosomal protein L37 mitochondrial [Penicillium chermesinum]